MFQKQLQITIFLLAWSVTPVGQAFGQSVWHVRPEGFIYETYWASAAEPSLGTRIVESNSHGSLIESDIGARLGLFRFGPHNREEGFQIDILGGAKLRQDWDSADVLSTDYRYDVLGTWGGKRHQWKFGFYHVSSHLGDEFLIANPDFHRLNFSRDALVLGHSFYPIEPLRLYGEVGWGFNLEHSEPMELQFGFDLGPPHPTGLGGAPFAAGNVHLREEVDFGGNITLQAGWAWRGHNSQDGALRTGLYFYDGKSPQFSFFDEHERQIGWGLWYDF